jgi:hypothetical protein
VIHIFVSYDVNKRGELKRRFGGGSGGVKAATRFTASSIESSSLGLANNGGKKEKDVEGCNRRGEIQGNDNKQGVLFAAGLVLQLDGPCLYYKRLIQD